MSENRGILVLAHGSKKEEANRKIRSLIESLKNRLGTERIEVGFMEFALPSIPQGIRTLKGKGCDEIHLLSLFIFNGKHYSQDIPKILDTVLKEERNIKVTLGNPLGERKRLLYFLEGEIEELLRNSEDTKRNLSPRDITEKSLAIIDKRLEGFPFSDKQRRIVQRVIHATAEPYWAEELLFHPEAIFSGEKAIKEGYPIITDVKMVEVGILEVYRHNTFCALDNSILQGKEPKREATRTSLGMELLSKKMDRGIVCIGNSPMALHKVLDLIDAGAINPALLIGVPVGFVQAKESKKRLAAQEKIPYITNLSRRGGSPVAAAIVNALILLANGQ